MVDAVTYVCALSRQEPHEHLLLRAVKRKQVRGGLVAADASRSLLLWLLYDPLSCCMPGVRLKLIVDTHASNGGNMSQAFLCQCAAFQPNCSRRGVKLVDLGEYLSQIRVRAAR